MLRREKDSNLRIISDMGLVDPLLTKLGHLCMRRRRDLNPHVITTLVFKTSTIPNYVTSARDGII